MKKLLSALLAAALTVSVAAGMTGCADYSKIEGFDEVDAARQKFTELDSAHVTVIDNVMSRLTVSYYFRYEGDMLTYLYMGRSGEEKYDEYHNGYEQSKADTAAEDWTVLTSADDSYVAYNRASSFPYSRKELLFLDGQSISGSEVTDNEDGGKTVVFHYDLAKLNSASQKQLETVSGSFTDEFNVSYTLDKDGNIDEMRQYGSLANSDGTISKVDSVFAITERNGLEPIEKPVLSELREGKAAYQTEKE